VARSSEALRASVHERADVHLNGAVGCALKTALRRSMRISWHPRWWRA
jgi:hypothetical protein